MRPGRPSRTRPCRSYDAVTQMSEGSAYTDEDGTFHVPANGTEPVKVRVSASELRH